MRHIIEYEEGRYRRLSPEETERLNGFPAGWTDIEGIKVGETQDELYKLYKLYYTEERGRPVLHFNAGTFFFSVWRRVELPAPAPEPPGEGRGLTGALQESSNSG